MVADRKSTGRAHSMPFGAEITAEGVLFRLWAPGAEKVDLVLEDGDGGSNFYPMAGENGWYRLLAAQAAAGSFYRFRINGGLLASDPVSRCQAEDIHGPSVVIDPLHSCGRIPPGRENPGRRPSFMNSMPAFFSRPAQLGL